MTDPLPEAVRDALTDIRKCPSVDCACPVYTDDLESAILAYGQQRYREGVEAALHCLDAPTSPPGDMPGEPLWFRHQIKRIRALLPSPTNGVTPTTGKVIDLMVALKASLAAKKSPPSQETPT